MIQWRTSKLNDNEETWTMNTACLSNAPLIIAGAVLAAAFASSAEAQNENEHGSRAATLDGPFDYRRLEDHRELCERLCVHMTNRAADS